MSYVPKSVFATLPNAQRGASLVLNGDPKGKNMLYCNGNSVVIRDIANPGIADVYTQHSVQATVAQYAPSGFYIASGDVSGKVRIWDTTQAEHILKYEYQPISGAIKDIAWSPDSKRLAISGEGREKFGHIILWDSGSSVGEITGHSKAINSIDYRPVRPFRVVTAGEDHLVCFFEGPPFKYIGVQKEHTRFVNIIRYGPNGELFCSGSADGKAIIYDGKTGEVKGCLGGDKSHAGGIYSLSWSPDSSKLLTASGDKTCKLWDVATMKAVSEFKMGTQVEDQQVSCLWQGSFLLSVSVAGYITYLDVNHPDKPLRVLKGHNKNLTSVAGSSDGTTVYGGSMDGRVSHWSVEHGDVDLMGGAGHTSLVKTLVATPDTLFSLGLDKTLKSASTSTNEYNPTSLSLPNLDPTGLAVGPDRLSVISTLTEVVLARDGERLATLPVTYEPQCVGFHPTEHEVAIGGKDSTVYVYSVAGDKFTQKTKFRTSGEISAIAYSRDGQSLAVTSGRSILVCSTSNYEQKHDLLRHTARVMAIDWSPDCTKLVSGSIDTSICIWQIPSGDCVQLKAAHPLSIISGVSWLSNTSFASCGHDCCIRIWKASA